MSRNVSFVTSVSANLWHKAGSLRTGARAIGPATFAAVLFCLPLIATGKEAAVADVELQTLRQQADVDMQQFLQALQPARRAQLRDAAEALVQRRLAAPSMARRLAGADNWQSLAALQKNVLSQEMARTVSRYLLEVTDLYSGQSVSIASILASSANRVQMQVLVHGVPGREQVPVVLDWVRAGHDWRIADFSVEGISYAATKRWQYQVLWQQGGYDQYQQHLKAKNDAFFMEWAARLHADAAVGVSQAGSPE